MVGGLCPLRPNWYELAFSTRLTICRPRNPQIELNCFLKNVIVLIICLSAAVRGFVKRVFHSVGAFSAILTRAVRVFVFYGRVCGPRRRGAASGFSGRTGALAQQTGPNFQTKRFLNRKMKVRAEWERGVGFSLQNTLCAPRLC